VSEPTKWVSRRTSADRREELPVVHKIHRRLASNQRATAGLRRRTRRGQRAFIKKDRQHDMLVRWSVAVGLLTLLAFAAIFSHWLKKQRGASAAANRGAVQHMRFRSNVDSPSSEEAVEFVRDAMLLTKPERVDEYFHLGECSRGEVIAFLEKNDYTRPNARYNWAGSLDANGLPLESVSIVLEGKDRTESYVALLHPDRSGTWKIDFPALVRICTPSWQDIEKNKPPTARVRVVASVDNYFNGPFTEGEWYSFRLSSPELNRWHYAYCRLGTPQAKAMRWTMNRNQQQAADEFQPEQFGRRVILDLKRVEGAQDNQYEIERVVAEDWILQKQTFQDQISGN